jgi:hypothetical protein
MTSETAVQQHARLELARRGGLPMRNNVGVAETNDGRFVRFGLMNTSKQENERFKSSDIICPVPIVIRPEHVGRTIAVFGAFETKQSGWHLTPGDKRGQAQLKFIELIRSVGGVAGFVSDPSHVKQLLDNW